ncbi:spore cortex biosynthesis protein YabQ [Caloranaerobacter azorensis DSM 13643]|uniref:Spore cortex biosynthesis protein YabQ n=1 Tax=Caloranaerobacter azorensis DSM 13643 TaxID=1121264 RepID=A0A1M5SVX6_9FIRM|nr:spore cortex biosynthesis protein YabQ [Caloranaerobacter azorensis]SHH42711.1 spore cortex biosynthesis protein YabQ [Caloranaerobacter azorensis DSM 13643]
MGNTVESQAYIFLLTVYGGILIGFVYDLYRIFRYFSKPNKIATLIEDLIFWIIVSIIALATLIFSNWGQLRGYVLLGFICGALIYTKLLSKPVITLMVYLVREFIELLKYIVNVLTYPFRFIIHLLSIPFRKINDRVNRFNRSVRKIAKLPKRIFDDIRKYANTILIKK